MSYRQYINIINPKVQNYGLMIVKKQMYGTNQTEKTSPFPHFLIFAFLCPNTPLFKGPIFFAEQHPHPPPSDSGLLRE